MRPLLQLCSQTTGKKDCYFTLLPRARMDEKEPPHHRRYGQTGTGKTFTMDGGAAPHLRGVIPRTFDHVFAFIKGGESGASQFLVRHASRGAAVLV